MVQNIPTTAESLKIYLQNQINQTDSKITSITQTIVRMNKDLEEAQSRVAKMEWANLIEDEQASLLNYMFRLDWLQNRLEELNKLV